MARGRVAGPLSLGARRELAYSRASVGRTDAEGHRRARRASAGRNAPWRPRSCAEPTAGGFMSVSGAGLELIRPAGSVSAGPVETAEVDRLVEFSAASRGIEPKIEVSAFADETLLAGLAQARGFVLREFEAVLARQLALRRGIRAGEAGSLGITFVRADLRGRGPGRGVHRRVDLRLPAPRVRRCCRSWRTRRGDDRAGGARSGIRALRWGGSYCA